MHFLNISGNDFNCNRAPQLNTILEYNLNKILVVKIDGSTETYFYSYRLNDNVGEDFVKHLACLISTNQDITKKLFSITHASNSDIEQKLLDSTRLVTISAPVPDLNVCNHRVTSRSISLSHKDLKNMKFQYIISGADILQTFRTYGFFISCMLMLTKPASCIGIFISTPPQRHTVTYNCH